MPIVVVCPISRCYFNCAGHCTKANLLLNNDGECTDGEIRPIDGVEYAPLKVEMVEESSGFPVEARK